MNPILKAYHQKPLQTYNIAFTLQFSYFFYKNTRIIFAQNLRTILASAEEQSLKLSM